MCGLVTAGLYRDTSYVVFLASDMCFLKTVGSNQLNGVISWLEWLRFLFDGWISLVKHPRITSFLLCLSGSILMQQLQFPDFKEGESLLSPTITVQRIDVGESFFSAFNTSWEQRAAQELLVPNQLEWHPVESIPQPKPNSYLLFNQAWFKIKLDRPVSPPIAANPSFKNNWTHAGLQLNTADGIIISVELRKIMLIKGQ